MTVRTEVLYNILTEFGVLTKLVRIIKMCLIETYSKGCIGKNYQMHSYSERSETRRCFIAIAFQLCFRICHQGGQRKLGEIGIEWNISVPGLCS
jgi:hypothetical protein